MNLLSAGITADVIITDINMPNMDGYEHSEQIRQSYKHAKIIARSMHDSEKQVEKAFQPVAGANTLSNRLLNTFVRH